MLLHVPEILGKQRKFHDVPELFLVLTVGQWVTYLKFFPPEDAGPWGRCTATHSRAGLCHQDTVPPQKQLHGDRADTDTVPHLHSWPGVQKNSRAMVPALTSAKPSPSCTSVCERGKHRQRNFCETFVTCNGFLGSSTTKDVTELCHPPRCGCTLRLSKPGEKRHHLLLRHLLIISD